MRVMVMSGWNQNTLMSFGSLSSSARGMMSCAELRGRAAPPRPDLNDRVSLDDGVYLVERQLLAALDLLKVLQADAACEVVLHIPPLVRDAVPGLLEQAGRERGVPQVMKR